MLNWLDRAIAGPFPGWAAGRIRARHILAAYEGANPSRTRKARKDRGSADAVVGRSAESLRIYARHLEQNYDVASGALDVLVANIVGSGIRPEPAARTLDGEPATEFNDALLDLFRDWIRAPEVTGEFDYYSTQRLAARAWLRDGEMFTQRIEGAGPTLDHGTRVPFSLELIEADMCPFLDDPAQRIIQGVRKNAWGRPLAYRFYLQHPGDHLSVSGQTKIVPADRITHLKLVNRIRQTRGVSVFASVIARLDDIKEIDESERVAARVAAAMTGYIKKGIPEMYSASEYEEDGHRLLSMDPGQIYDDLRPGEDVGTIASNRPNNALIPFRDSQLRSAAAGLGVSHSSLSKNYNGTYSAQRQELVEQSAVYGTPWGYFVNRWCQPNWESFVRMAMASGQVRLPPNIDRNTITDCDHSRPALPWIDPVKEVKADLMGVEGRLWSRSDAQRRRGLNPDEVRQRILRERERDQRDGLTDEESE